MVRTTRILKLKREQAGRITPLDAGHGYGAGSKSHGRNWSETGGYFRPGSANIKSRAEIASSHKQVLAAPGIHPWITADVLIRDIFRPQFPSLKSQKQRDAIR